MYVLLSKNACISALIEKCDVAGNLRSIRERIKLHKTALLQAVQCYRLIRLLF